MIRETEQQPLVLSSMKSSEPRGQDSVPMNPQTERRLYKTSEKILSPISSCLRINPLSLPSHITSHLRLPRLRLKV